MSVRIISALSVVALLAACSTTKESPIYQQSTKYKVHSPTTATTSGSATTSYASYSTGAAQDSRAHNTTTTAPVTYVQQTSSPTYSNTTAVNHECLNKEGDRKLIGTGVGGAAGALAGHELIGGTKGTVIGAVVGGAAGYGIADKTIDCDPIQVATPSYTTPASHTYATTTTTTAPTTASEYDAGYQAGYLAASTTTETQASPVEISPIETPSADLSDLQGSTTEIAPTDSAYGDTFGTPGYHAMQANGEIDTTTSTASISIPDPEPTIVASEGYPQLAEQSTTAPITSYPTYGAPKTSVPSVEAGISMHKVVEGNTVYSLARERCVGVEDIRNLNSLDGNFSIKLDDYIKLPVSRC